MNTAESKSALSTVGTVTWLPMSDLPHTLTKDDVLLLWIPSYWFAGPATMAYRLNDQWISSATHGKITGTPTAFAYVNTPDI